MNLPTPKSWEEFEEITLDALEHSLREEELIVFKIGQRLAKWNRFEFDNAGITPVSDEFLNPLLGMIAKLYGGKVPERILEQIKLYRTNHTHMDNATVVGRVYGKFSQLLLEAELQYI